MLHQRKIATNLKRDFRLVVDVRRNLDYNFETFVVSEILKSYSNEGKDYRFNIFYYRGKDRKTSGENEIDLIIEENGILYPIEIKMSGNPKGSMGAANQVLDKVPDKKRGMGIILCLVERKLYLRENLLALPIEFV